ncbi:hypothetical protein [Marinobacterium jannaschii]|uniref:hypothetical protein n=1 Tax=Marinobacterium jannaschii TaxID=64970 RepID=UPI000481409F|nr:hypothetical protein [Marinobacterium jannaschii]
MLSLLRGVKKAQATKPSNIRKLNPAERINLYEVLADRADQGAFAEGIEKLALLYQSRKGKSSAFKAALYHHIRATSSRKGQQIATSLSGLIPDDEKTTITTMESAGRLADGFKRARVQVEESIARRKQISAMLIPIIFYALSLYGVIKVMGTMVLPIMVKDGSSNALIILGSNIEAIGFALIAMIVAAYFYLAKAIPHGDPTGSIRKFLDNYVPPWSLFKIFSSIAFLEGFAVMKEADKSDKEAFIVLRSASNSLWYRSCINRMMENLRNPQYTALANNPIFSLEANDNILSMGSSISPDYLLRLAESEKERADKLIGITSNIIKYTTMALIVAVLYQVFVSYIEGLSF